jgi:hypothetical protein
LVGNVIRGVFVWLLLVGIVGLPHWIVLIPLHDLLLGNAMFIMAAHGLYFILVPLMALLLSYFEIWPERAIGAVFGDPSRLWEYDPGNPKSKRRLP